MSWCAIKKCKSGSKSKKYVNYNTGDIRFHRFPKNPFYQQIWSSVCNRKNLNTNNAYICSLHFDADAYCKPLIETLLNYSPRQKRKLKSDAVPTLKLSKLSCDNSSKTTYSLETSLRWYLLGKYSNSVFTEHRNTEDTNEESLINCLSACTVNKAECSLELLKEFELQMLTNELHMSDIEKDCLEYVTGSVARKFLSKYPSLGEKVGNVIGSDSSWTEQMSKGNLIKPSKSMIQVAKVLEVVFNEYHTKNTLRKTPGVMKNVRDILVSKLQNIIDIPVEVLECMVRTRTFIRLNSMNKQLMDKVISTKNKIKKFVS